MEKITLHIKNMVCGRCIRIVKQILEEAGYEVHSVTLGEAVVSSLSGNIDYELISSILLENGFELIEDKKVRLIEKIKNTIIRLVREDAEDKQNLNYSYIIAKETGADYNYLSSLFSSHEDITIEKYIILQKIEYVKELLKYEELSLNEIAFRLGYSSVQHLSNQFKKVTGLSATEYKKLKSPPRKELDKI